MLGDLRHFLIDWPILDGDVSLSVAVLIALLIAAFALGYLALRRDTQRLRERLRVIISSAGIGVWEWDLRRNRGRWDDSMYRLYGVKPADTSPDYEGWKQMVHEEDRARVIAEFEGAVRAGSVGDGSSTRIDISFRIITKNNQIETIRSVGEVLRDSAGRPRMLQGVSWSISRELHLVAESERQKRFTEDILDSIADPVFMKDREHRWIYGNRAFSNLIGASREEYLGKSDFDFFSPELATLYWAGDDLTLSEMSAREFEEESVRGEMARMILTKKSPVRLPSGEIGVIGIIRDITDRVQMEKQLEDQRARQIAASRLASLGEMAGGMAHEINNPLAIILAYATRLGDLLESMQDAKLDNDGLSAKKRSREIAERIEKTALRISTIVKSLRTIARDGSRDEMEAVAVDQLVDETLSLCLEAMKTTGVKLETNFFALPEKSHVRGRRVQLSQVLLNLISNAFFAVANQPDGRIRILARPAFDDAGEACVEIVVEDNGPGVPAEIRERIFEPFFTTKPVGQGTGLGLSIAASVMREHGGHLVLDDTADEEWTTRFIVRLPAQAVKPE